MSLITQAMEDFHDKTCLRFVKRTNENNFIRFFAGEGCYSNVGMVGGQQSVSLGTDCMFKGVIIHELGRAVGFYNEQNRSDRDDFLIIKWENIMSGMADDFAKLKPDDNLLLVPFDYNSIMMDGSLHYSKDGKSPTMEAKDGTKLYETYEKNGLSDLDASAVKKMYEC